MSIGICHLHPLFFGEVHGVEAGKQLDAETVRALSEAIDRYAVLVLRDQKLDDERQMALRGISASWNCRAAAVPMSSGGFARKCLTSRTSTSRTGCAGAT